MKTIRSLERMLDDNASQIMKIPWVEEEKAKSEPQGEQEVKQCSELNGWRNSLTPHSHR